MVGINGIFGLSGSAMNLKSKCHLPSAINRSKNTTKESRVTKKYDYRLQEKANYYHKCFIQMWFIIRFENNNKDKNGWGTRIRTWECRDQNPVPYHLAIPQLFFISKGSTLEEFDGTGRET